MPVTGSAKRMHTPRSPLVANVRPPSANDRCAGPAVFKKLYGPEVSEPVMLSSWVRTNHGPNRIRSSLSSTTTAVVRGVTPNSNPGARYASAKAKSNRSTIVCTPEQAPGNGATLIDVSHGSTMLERAERIADDVLFPHAQVRDRAALLPPDGFDALAEAGLFGIAGPPTQGGGPIDVATLRRIMAAVGSGCGATFFVWVQHHGVVRSLTTSPNTDLAERLLPELCRGARIAGIAFAHVRRPGTPAVRATRCDAGWRLDGHAPWATSWGIAEHFCVAAVTDDDPEHRELVRVVVPGNDAGPGSPFAMGVTALHLPVFASTGTVELDFDGFEVADADVIDVQPLRSWQAGDRAHASIGQPAVLGVADRAIRLLADRPDSDARSACARLRAELAAAWARDDELLSTLTDPTEAAIAAASDHRAACLYLARRATTAFLAASGGGGMDLSHPAQRLMREADFYVIQAQTADGRTATLRNA